jgi:DNA-directed RNA polymerase subunit M
MGSWTCPNTKCTYDKQLQPEQPCPLCGEQAKEFDSSELGNLWTQKWNLKKSIEKAKKQERISHRRKYCPKCGSSNINFLVFYRSSMWRCLNCGYEGTLLIEDKQLAEKIRKHYQNNKQK